MNATESPATARRKVETPEDELTYTVIGLAMAVHNALGPGFPEEVYHRALEVALGADGIPYEREVRIQVTFRDHIVGAFELDLAVCNTVIVELTALSAVAPVHEQQAIANLAASGLPVALPINLGATRLQYKRIFPPLSVQSSPAYQTRRSISTESE